MKLFTQADISDIIGITMREQAMSEHEFVDKVACDIAVEISKLFASTTPVLIFAGPDRCGAYALAAGAELYRMGYSPHAFLFNIGGNRLSEECAEARRSFVALSDDVILTEVTGLRFSMPEIDPGMVVVDGLFDGNISAPLSRGYQVLVSNINDSGACVVSIDTPSGLPADPMSGLINSKIIHACLTLAVMLPKLSFFINDNAGLVGEWKVVGPSPSPSAVRSVRSSYFLIDGSSISRRLRPRPLDCSKNDFGTAVVFAGSYGMMGASVLAAKAACRSGCGKVICHAPKCGYEILQSAVPSALYEPDGGEKCIEEIELTHNCTAVAIGPGMGTADATIRSLEDFLKMSSANNRPLVLDADALNCISLRPAMLDYLPVLSVLTPHAGEFDRIFGTQQSSSARLAKAVELSRRYKIIIVLKGYYTATVRPDGRVFFNSSGTPALATAGSGDVLTGLMTGLIAQGLKPEIASVAAVYLHGVAGTLAAETHGEYGVCASDIADNIGRAIKTVLGNNRMSKTVF